MIPTNDGPRMKEWTNPINMFDTQSILLNFMILANKPTDSCSPYFTSHLFASGINSILQFDTGNHNFIQGNNKK